MPNPTLRFLSLFTGCLLAALAGPAAEAQPAGAVYVMTNARAANEIQIYDRAEDGRLTFRTTVPTDGRGSGGVIDPLGSQGALTLSADERWLFAVNAGSSELSLFEVEPGGLRLVDTIQTGGGFPVSVTVHENLVYVLNARGRPSVRGFRVRDNGTLRRVRRGRLFLETSAGGNAQIPTQVAFTPDGSALVAVDRGPSEITVIPIDPDNGRPGTPEIFPSAGRGPFGFTFARQRYLLVTEIFGGTDGSPPGSLSSYELGEMGGLTTVSPSVPSRQGATCWVVTSGRRWAFTTNTSGDTVTGYRVRRNGQLQRLGNGVSVRFAGAARPTDAAITADGRYLYVLNAGTGTIGALRVQRGGRLTLLGEVPGPPASAGAQGIAAR